MKNQGYNFNQPMRGLFWTVAIFCFALMVGQSADAQDELERELQAQALEKKV